MHLFCYLCLSLPNCHVCFFQPCGHLSEKADILALLVFLCFWHFPLRFPGSGVILDYIDS